MLKMPNYSQGKIYAIKSPHMDKYYIGSTCQTLEKRLKSHYKDLKLYNEGKKNSYYCSSYEIIKAGQAYIELIEMYPTETKNSLQKREGELQRLYYETIVNKNIAGRSKIERYQDNKHIIAKKQAIYALANKEKLVKYRAEYYQKNKEKLSKQQSKYNKANFERLKQIRSQLIYCGCGQTLSKRNISRHFKSQKHLNYVERRNICSEIIDELISITCVISK